MFVCCECCVLSGRGLCDELITRPEESYRLWCVVVCDLEALKNEEAMTRVGLQRHKKKKWQSIRKLNAVDSRSTFSRYSTGMLMSLSSVLYTSLLHWHLQYNSALFYYREIIINLSTRVHTIYSCPPLTLILLTWRKWWAPNNASK